MINLYFVHFTVDLVKLCVQEVTVNNNKQNIFFQEISYPGVYGKRNMYGYL